MGFLCFLKKEQNLFLLKKQQKIQIKKIKNIWVVFFEKKTGFS